MHTDTHWQFDESRRSYSRDLYTYSQAHWLDTYEVLTTFEPMVDDYEAGNETLEECFEFNVSWFLSWAAEQAEDLRSKIAALV